MVLGEVPGAAGAPGVSGGSVGGSVGGRARSAASFRRWAARGTSRIRGGPRRLPPPRARSGRPGSAPARRRARGLPRRPPGCRTPRSSRRRGRAGRRRRGRRNPSGERVLEQRREQEREVAVGVGDERGEGGQQFEQQGSSRRAGRRRRRPGAPRFTAASRPANRRSSRSARPRCAAGEAKASRWRSRADREYRGLVGHAHGAPSAARGKKRPRRPLLDAEGAKSAFRFAAGRSSHGPAARIAARFPPPSIAGRGPPPPRTPPRSALRADGGSPDFLPRAAQAAARRRWKRAAAAAAAPMATVVFPLREQRRGVGQPGDPRRVQREQQERGRGGRGEARRRPVIRPDCFSSPRERRRASRAFSSSLRPGAASEAKASRARAAASRAERPTRARRSASRKSTAREERGGGRQLPDPERRRRSSAGGAPGPGAARRRGFLGATPEGVSPDTRRGRRPSAGTPPAGPTSRRRRRCRRRGRCRGGEETGPCGRRAAGAGGGRSSAGGGRSSAAVYGWNSTVIPPGRAPGRRSGVQAEGGSTGRSASRVRVSRARKPGGSRSEWARPRSAGSPLLVEAAFDDGAETAPREHPLQGFPVVDEPMLPVAQEGVDDQAVRPGRESESGALPGRVPVGEPPRLLPALRVGGGGSVREPQQERQVRRRDAEAAARNQHPAALLQHGGGFRERQEMDEVVPYRHGGRSPAGTGTGRSRPGGAPTGSGGAGRCSANPASRCPPQPRCSLGSSASARYRAPSRRSVRSAKRPARRARR